MITNPAAQEVCQRCGAWLPVRLDVSEFRILRPRASRPQVSAPFPDVGRDLVGGHDLGRRDDYTLRSWILSFGRGARILAPAPLVQWIWVQLAEAGRQYGAGGQLPAFAGDMQPPLPFAFARLPRT
jgi:hypothetical protein